MASASLPLASLPIGWSRFRSDGIPCYVYKPTGHTQRIPPVLRYQVVDSNGCIEYYYHDASTSVTTWTEPKDVLGWQPPEQTGTGPCHLERNSGNSSAGDGTSNSSSFGSSCINYIADAPSSSSRSSSPSSSATSERPPSSRPSMPQITERHDDNDDALRARKKLREAIRAMCGGDTLGDMRVAADMEVPHAKARHARRSNEPALPCSALTLISRCPAMPGGCCRQPFHRFACTVA